MISKDIVRQIKEELELTDTHINDIAIKFKVSKASVNNINAGKSHKEERLYPIRQPSNYYFTDNEVAFIRLLAKEGYSAKQIHIILTKGSYSTISNIISHKTRPGDYEYTEDNFLNERRRVFDFIATPHPELVNQFTDNITYEDGVYVKLLGRFMANLVDTLVIFIPLMESEMIGFKYRIETREDMERYLEWGGSYFKTVWWVKNIFNNKVNRLEKKLINYDSFPINRFREVNPTINLVIIKEMIAFETKENYRKSDAQI